MNRLTTLLNYDVVSALGWTLLHSLWQGLILYALIALALRSIPVRLSHVRYGVALSGIALILLACICTFLYVLPTHTHQQAVLSGQNVTFANISAVQVSSSWLDAFSGLIQRQLPLIVTGWFIGMAFFSLRMAGGWWYVWRIRQEAQPMGVDNKWAVRVYSLAYRLNIKTSVLLATSNRLSVPIVTGLFKPMIVFPISIFTGLTPDQIDSILLHELIHIRRKDYLINIIQMMMETVFFFNPFVWMLSSIIRREREYCCDDDVIQYSCDARNYAEALTRLETIHLHTPTFALAAATDKYQLLNRIKRLMEKSVNTQPSWNKFIPIVLLVTGLVCTSWLSFNHYPTDHETDASAAQTVADTVKKKKEKKARYKHKAITTVDEEGKVREEIVEEFAGDEELRPVIRFHYSNDTTFTFQNGFANGFDFDMPTVDFHFMTDSMPYVFEMQMSTEEMQRALEEANHALAQHEHALENIMHEFQVSVDVDHEQWEKQFEMEIELNNKLIESEMNKVNAIHEVHIQNMQKSVQATMQAQERKLSEMHIKMEALQQRMEALTETLTNELIKDGYLKQSEQLSEVKIDQDGKVTINGAPVKESDQKKYEKLIQKLDDWKISE